MNPKLIVIGIIILIVTVSWCPTLAAEQERRHAMTVEICDQGHSEQHTVMVSEDVAAEIMTLFAQISGALDAARSTQEKLEVYRSAIDSMDAFNLLNGLSVEQAYHMVTRWYRPPNARINTTFSLLNNRNAFCLVTGRTNLTFTTHRFASWFFIGGWALFEIGLEIGLNLYDKYPIIVIFAPLWILTVLGVTSLGSAFAHRADMNSLAVADEVGIGFQLDINSDITYGSGWLKTVGLLGIRMWEGDLAGDLPGTAIPDNLYSWSPPAIWGFSGIKLWLNDDGSEKSYLGSAILVGLNEKTP